MPSLEKYNNGNFGFSAAKLDTLGASEYTLATLVLDRSGSTGGFQKDMEACVKEIIRACQRSPRADNMMVRVITFDNHHQEVHGFKLLSDCNEADYDGILAPGGSTALVDSSVDAVEATKHYADSLVDNDFEVNGIIFIMTDGWENASTLTTNDLVKAIEATVREERLESLTTLLIGINAAQAGNDLRQFVSVTKIDEYIEVEKADKKSLARLAKFASSSITSKSQSLQQGMSNSVSLTF